MNFARSGLYLILHIFYRFTFILNPIWNCYYNPKNLKIVFKFWWNTQSAGFDNFIILKMKNGWRCMFVFLEIYGIFLSCISPKGLRLCLYHRVGVHVWCIWAPWCGAVVSPLRNDNKRRRSFLCILVGDLIMKMMFF